MRNAALTLATAALAAFPAAAAAGLIDPGAERAALATTGNHSELIESVPVTTEPGLGEQVVMSLGPERLRRFRTGDRLRVSGEVQVSTTCLTSGPRCVGRPYSFNPWITARIALAGSPEVGVPSVPVSAAEQVKCKQRRPQRNHHCTIALPNVETTIADAATLPCAATNQCYVNLIVGAWNRRARPGNRVVVGADRPDGEVVQDKGRLNVVNARAETPPPSELASAARVNDSLPLNEGKRVKRRVIYSVEIPAPRKSEVLAFDGNWSATIDELPYNVFIASRVIVADSPTSTEPGEVAKLASQFRGDATEANGFNCTQGPSGYSTPCTIEKAGAVRITRDALDPVSGLPVPLYLNLVSAAKPLLYPRQRIKAWQRVQVTALDGLSLSRYSP